MEEPLSIDETAAAVLRRIVAARESIEQAKGAIMLAYGLDPTQAFAVLRTASQETNHKVRHVAADVVAVLPNLGTPRCSLESVRAHLDHVLYGVSDDSPTT
ncbi:ANTAR domain-containing protein [Nocardia bovistercoris]|uniref:ANTAR domain-containing protein n=1 Tax=Nocardia bovistercoris TaxID=2785916 RepID=A0A931N612_9NOCA|nr:ANTAR domain-containing protein [Nocardia bovistercoris]MBH0780454.1 ANTAR domain-containing protein [Nocardia bovistercoris]